MRDADERRAVRKAAKAEALRQSHRDDAIKALLNSEVGREYLWWLLSISRVGQQPFSADPLVTAFSCGELNIGQQILAHILDVHPEGYISLLKEKQNERRSADNGTDEPGDDHSADDPDS